LHISLFSYFTQISQISQIFAYRSCYAAIFTDVASNSGGNGGKAATICEDENICEICVNTILN